MTQVHQLYQLQESDLEIRDKKKRLGEVLQTLKGPPWLLAARADLETAVSNLNTLQSQRNTLNLELQSLRSKAKTSETRLYSGKVVNTKEMSDLQHEIDSLNHRAASVEDEILELMLLMEEAEAEKNAADQAAAAAEERWKKESVDLEVEKNVLAVRLNHLIQHRQEQASVVDAALLKEYEQLAKKKGGTAVTRLRVDMCLGCRMTVSSNYIIQAKEGKKAYCGSCGRILYPYDG